MKVDRVFLDASILFSAGQGEAGLFRLWELADKGRCKLLASRYVIEKAIRNLRLFDDLKRLESRLPSVQVVLESDIRLSCPIELPERAKAVFMAAISSKSDYFLTGDNEHYREYLGQSIMGVKILKPRGYLLEKESTNVPHHTGRTSLRETSLR
jgi:predicted nucleic acid-binding protein